MGFLNGLSPQTLALLRVIAGLCFMEHGAMKLLHFPAPFMGGMALTPLLTAAGVIELVGGALIVLGLFTKPAAFIASGETAVAFFGFHVLNAFHMMPATTPVTIDPQANGGEAAALYAVIFLYIASAGGGAFALDSLLGKKRGLEPS